MKSTFASLGVAPWLQKVTKEMGFQNATEIQEKCIPPILLGHNLVGRAKTVFN